MIGSLVQQALIDNPFCSHSQIFSRFCLPHQPKFSDFFNLYLHWVSVISGQNHQIFINGDQSGKEMIIRTIENVNDFSDIRHSYLKNLSASTKKRQEKLLQDHYFLCECTRCLDTKSDNLKNSMKCTKCNSGCVLKLVKK